MEVNKTAPEVTFLVKNSLLVVAVPSFNYVWF
jgi:hypothetical protein